MASEVFQPYHNISKTPPNIAAGRNKSGTAALAEDTLDHLLRFLKESDGSPGRTDAAIASERDDGTLNLFAIQMRDLRFHPLHSTGVQEEIDLPNFFRRKMRGPQIGVAFVAALPANLTSQNCVHLILMLILRPWCL